MPSKTLFASTETITRAELFARLQSAVSPAHFRKLKSLAGRALDLAGYAADSPLDLRVALTNLERSPATKGIHVDAPAACRKVRELAIGGRGTERIAPSRGFVLLPAPWYDLLCYAQEDRKGRIRNRLLSVVRALEYMRRLEASPAGMPSTADLLVAGAALGLARHTMRTAISGYRRLRKKAIKSDPANEKKFAPIPDGRRARGRGAAAVLFAQGHGDDVVDPMEALKQLAPVFHRQLLKYLKAPVVKGRHHKPNTIQAIRATSFRLVGDIAVHAPELLATFSIKELWRQSRPLDEIDCNYEEWDEIPTSETEVPLARWLIAKIAPPIRERCAPMATTGYPTMIEADLKNWFSLTEHAHGQKLRDGDLRLWEEWRSRYKNIRQHVRENRIPEDQLLLAKDKKSIVETFTMSHVWCVGLPVLMRESERLLNRLEAELEAARKARVDGDPFVIPAVRQAADAFETSAERTIYTALVFYDGMRAAQYAGAMWGDHIRPDVDEKTKEWLSIQTRWVGHRLDSATVKQGKARARELGPGPISFRLFQAYLQYVRAPRLTARGVDPAAAMEPNGRYPLFVSPAAGSSAVAFSAEHLRIRVFGPTLYRMATEFFGKYIGDAKSYEEVDRRAHFGMFGIHMARYVNATGCYRILENPTAAQKLTSDTTKTLEGDYVVDTWLAEGREGSWRNALSYRPWLERMIQPLATERPLETMPAELLPPGVHRLFERWNEEDQALARSVMRNTYGSPSGRVRAARPDVADRNRQRAAERRATKENLNETKAA